LVQERGLTAAVSVRYGLSYTRLGTAAEDPGRPRLTVSFTVTNTGPRSGARSRKCMPSRQAALSSAGRFHKVAFESRSETRRVSVTADRRLLADFDTGPMAGVSARRLRPMGRRLLD